MMFCENSTAPLATARRREIHGARRNLSIEYPIESGENLVLKQKQKVSGSCEQTIGATPALTKRWKRVTTTVL